ncbi:hypothetical protein JCM8202_005757 [Rhodotorula sphaerocarpa]
MPPPPRSGSTNMFPPADASATAHSNAFTRKLLRHYYSTVCTLSDLLPPNGADLVRDGDPDSYRRLVGETVVASRALTGPPALLDVSTGGGVASMAEIIEQTQQRIFAVHAKVYYREKKAGNVAFATPKNMLTFGYRLNTEKTRELTRTRSQLEQGFVEVFPNTIVASLVTSRDWETLSSRAGPDWLIELFSSPDTALFLPLPNACLMQISGTPVADLRTLEDSHDVAFRMSRRTQHEPRKRKRSRRNRHIPDAAPDELEGVAGETMPADVPASTPPIPRLMLNPPATATPVRSGPAVAVPASAGAGRSATAFSPAATLISPARQHSLTPSSTTVSPTKRALRATRSGASLLAGGTSASELGERPAKRRKLETLNSNNTIVLARHQMYHHRLSKGTGGKLPYGLSPRNILVRLSLLYPPIRPEPESADANKGSSEAAARHLAKYVFPRHFGLHNVFTNPKPRVSVDVLPDYVDREFEIKRLGTTKTPPRLKAAIPLLQKMKVLSSRCNMRKILDKRCPSRLKHSQLTEEDRSAILELSSAEPHTQVSRGEVSLDVSHNSLVLPHGQTQALAQRTKKPKLSEYACEVHSVERYVLECVRDVIPRAFWGSEANRKLVESNVAKVLRYRRFESVSLHALLQGFSVLDCAWLGPQSASAAAQRTTPADMQKRHELLSEFMYWFFDSFILDLVKTAFYVTDSVTHHNRPLYFRQDDWNKLCAPLLKQLGDSVFEKVPLVEALALQKKRELGVSFVRLLPKETGVRPIVNLARRPIKVSAGGRREVGQPINKVLQGVFDVLTFEAKRKPHLVGSLVADPQDIYSKLRHFKRDLLTRHGGDNLPELYFVKVDVRACYDTIQQDKLLDIVEDVLEETVYWIQRYTQISPLAGMSLKSFKRVACTDGELGMFEELAIKLAQDVHNIVISDSVAYTNVGRDRLMQLLKEHITSNLVKVGGRLYRQKEGIPQGSILSSLLCSLFYGDMEKTRLAFTSADESLLLRYVDDFLFVTTDLELATRFLRVMHAGLPEYGCFISPEKRLSNFDVALTAGEVVPPLPKGEDFPWCGLLIDPETLEVRFSTVASENDIADQLTIQRFRKPGRAFRNAMFRAVKIRTRIMYLDTAHNTPATAYGNVYRGLLVVALKFQAYVQEWGVDPRKKSAFLYNILQQILAFQWSAIVNQSRSFKAQTLHSEMGLKRSWVAWLGLHAFRRVLSRRPALYSTITSLLVRELRNGQYGAAQVHLQKVVNHKSTAFADRGNGGRKAARM